MNCYNRFFDCLMETSSGDDENENENQEAASKSAAAATLLHDASLWKTSGVGIAAVAACRLKLDEKFDESELLEVVELFFQKLLKILSNWTLLVVDKQN